MCSDSGDSDGVDSKTDSPKKARKAVKREEKNNKEAEKERRKKQSHEKVLIKHFVLIVTELWCQVSYQKQFTVVSMLFNSSFTELLLFLIFPSIIVAFHSVPYGYTQSICTNLWRVKLDFTNMSYFLTY